jgi:threonine/homoserine/homoserine lactone efflux protein
LINATTSAAGTTRNGTLDIWTPPPNPRNLNLVDTGYIDLTVLPAFMAAVLVICCAPGPDMAYIVAVGVRAGSRAAARAAIGVTAGMTCYVVAVAAGLGRLMQQVPALTTGIRVAGLAYLLWLAWTTARDLRSPASPRQERPAASDHEFRRGLLINLSNPKVMLFFVAFLPQFLGHATAPTAQLLLLGVLFQLTGLAVDLSVGLGTGRIRDRLLHSRRIGTVLSGISVLIYLGLAGVITAELVSS